MIDYTVSLPILTIADSKQEALEKVSEMLMKAGIIWDDTFVSAEEMVSEA